MKKKRNTQQSLAFWTSIAGSASLLVPLIGILAILGAQSFSLFWMGSVALVVFAFFTFAILKRMEKDTFGRNEIGWIISLIYFITLFAVVAFTFHSFGIAMFLAFPEVVGITLSIIGLINSLEKKKTA